MFKNNYPRLIPRFLSRIFFKIFTYITYPVAFVSGSLQLFMASILSKMTIIGLTFYAFLYLLDYTTTLESLSLLSPHTSVIIVILFFIGYTLTHFQIAPVNTTMIRSINVTIGYPKLFVLAIGIFVSFVFLSFQYQNIILQYLSLPLGLFIVYYYITSVFRRDRESRTMDDYKIEFFAPFTSGLFYAYLLSIFIVNMYILSTALGILFAFNSLLFYRYRKKRYESDKSHKVRDLYDFVGLSPQEISSKITELSRENKLDKSASEIYSDESIRKLMTNQMEWSEFESKIAKDHSNQTETIDEDTKNEIRTDVKWSWVELNEEIEKYADDYEEVTFDFDNFSLEDVSHLKSIMTDIKDENDLPKNLDKAINRFIKKLDNTEKYWEKMKS